MAVGTVVAHAADEQRRGRIFIAAAALAWSTAGFLQRGLAVSTATQLAGRAAFTACGIFVYVAVLERGRVVRAFRALGRDGIAIAVLFAISSSCFITALNHATVAHVLFMQALAPIMAAAIAVPVLHECVTRTTAFAMALAVAGVGAMVGAPGRASVVGEVLALLMSLSFAAVLVLARRGRTLTMAPATCLSQVLVFAAFAPFAHPGQIGGHDLALLALLGLGQMGLGLIFLTLGAHLIPAAEVALISLVEVVLGPLWVWLADSERPSLGTMVGGSVVLLAVVVQTGIFGTCRRQA